MYETIKKVIESGRFELSAILKKIDTIWLQGDITDEERTELVTLAREKADPSDSYAPLQEQINKAFEEIEALKNKMEELHGGEVEPPETEYPEYVQPTGAHDAYHKDDKITFESERYICIAPDGVAVVWSPAQYPAYWQKVE